jgi:hypothetical protein
VAKNKKKDKLSDRRSTLEKHTIGELHGPNGKRKETTCPRGVKRGIRYDSEKPRSQKRDSLRFRKILKSRGVKRGSQKRDSEKHVSLPHLMDVVLNKEITNFFWNVLCVGKMIVCV